MAESQLLEFAVTNPSIEQMEAFLFRHPELDARDVEAVRTAIELAKDGPSKGHEFFRGLDRS
jgi:hypothetical protein